MPMPESLKVGGFTYRRRSGPTVELELATNGNVGESNHEKLEFMISETSSLPHAQKTILHELFHMLAWQTQLGKEWGDKEEAYVTRLTFGLFAVFKDNPDGNPVALNLVGLLLAVIW